MDHDELPRAVDAAHRRLDALQDRVSRLARLEEEVSEIRDRVTRMEATIEITLGEIRARLDTLANVPADLAALRAEIKSARRTSSGRNGDWQRWALAAIGWIFGLIALLLGHLLRG